MKQKFDEFVRQQSAAIEAFEAQTDTVLLAIEGSSSGSGLAIMDILQETWTDQEKNCNNSVDFILKKTLKESPIPKYFP